MKRKNTKYRIVAEKSSTGFLIFLIILFSATLSAAENLGGHVSLNSSYDSNAGTNLSTTITGKRKSSDLSGDFSGELSSDIFVYPYKGIYFDYMNSLSYTFTDSQYSFFFHNAELAYEFEFEKLDIILGFQLGHTVYDFTESYNRIEVGPYFELMFYPSEIFSNSVRISFFYQKPFDSLDIFNKGYGVSLDAGELFHLFGKKSILFVNTLFSVYFLNNSTETFDTTTVEKKNSYITVSQFLKMKIHAGILEIVPGVTYEFLYFLEKDLWNNFEKRRYDHLISPSLSMILNFSSHFSLGLIYKYDKNISNIGEDSKDYYDLSYDRHRVFLELSSNF